MKKLTCQMSGVLFLLGLLAGPALAGFYKSQLICDEGVTGRANIKSNGTLKVKAKTLVPGNVYEVEITCGCVEDNISDEDSEPFEIFVTAGTKGKINVRAKNALVGAVCDCPAVVIEDDEENVICTSGFGTQVE